MTEEVIVKRWRSIKDKTPICGIDDGGFNRLSDEFLDVPVYGVIMKGSAYVEGIIQCQIRRDDPLANKAIRSMILKSSHKNQIQAIFLQGISIGGFGVIDINSLSNDLGIPVIVVLRKYPDYNKIRSALEKVFPGNETRWNTISQAGELIEVQKKPLLLIQISGIHPQDAFSLLKKCTVVGTIPEALRIAHFIGASNYRYIIETS